MYLVPSRKADFSDYIIVESYKALNSLGCV